MQYYCFRMKSLKKQTSNFTIYTQCCGGGGCFILSFLSFFGCCQQTSADLSDSSSLFWCMAHMVHIHRTVMAIKANEPGKINKIYASRQIFFIPKRHFSKLRYLLCSHQSQEKSLLNFCNQWTPLIFLTIQILYLLLKYSQ